ncbi:NAD-dependent epimerase [Draconibacterium sp.]|nr:NAD-dependent epimerase [Draconibacterium sp.]
MKILVTGTAGFIGYHLAKKLLERGDTVVGIDNINDYYDVELKYARLKETGISKDAEQWHKPVQSTKYKKYSFIRMNLEDRVELNKLFELEKFDTVCNLAAQAGVRYSLQNPHAYINSNVVGFMNILEACRDNNIQHLVYASSSSVYGHSPKMPLSIDDRVDHPISLYAATKKSNELMAHTYSHLFQIPTTGLRFFTVYGPWGRPDMAPILFANAITNSQPIKVFNNGNLERDFTYVSDIVEGVIRVIDNPPNNKNNTLFSPPQGGDASVRTGAGWQRGYDIPTNRSIENGVVEQNIPPYAIHNIGNGNPVKLMDFIKTLENAIGKPAEKQMMPMQPGDVYKTFADVSALKEQFGYAPETSLKEGITEFVKWYQEYYGD